MLDLDALRRKVVDHVPISESEINALIAELEHFRSTAAYLADCHAASAEGLPRSTSKYSRKRHAEICSAAALLIQGVSGVGMPRDIHVVSQRCLDAAAPLRQPDGS